MKLLLYTLHTIPPKIELNLYLQKKVKTWDLATVNTWIEQVSLSSHYSHRLCFKAILILLYSLKTVFMLAQHYLAAKDTDDT